MMRRAGTPLFFYYAVTLGLPLANGAGGRGFWEHGLVVLAVPLILVGVCSLVRLAPAFGGRFGLRRRRGFAEADSLIRVGGFLAERDSETR